ncbi:MAG: NUDIX hydrolase, partial [Candidatus Kapabacteria bacterium]|nr:NUDIX hydrolase [Candidatus Kapabacteria bacterium]
SETVLTNPYWRYKHDIYRLHNGKEADYYYAETNGSVFIIPQFEDGRYILVKQFRYLNQKVSLEFPGGGLKDGYSTLEQAHEELREEAGLEASGWDYLGAFNPMNGVTNELCHVYLATGLTRVGAAPEESEQFEFVEMNSDDIRNAISSNDLWDGMTLAAWAMLRSRMDTQ